MKIKIRKKES